MDRFVCIHGHFYQPPRENPWLEAIELQDSAYPYHDWNERITEECYAANARSRILDGEGRIAQIVNNYSRISFNFGPNLLAWMEVHAPEIYAAIIEADRESRKRFSGHGSGSAQVYNHMIMPLANRRDKLTQVLWGIADFRKRFGREPEGMWLAETAVDHETLSILADCGIQFTILSPYQAARVRPLGKVQRPWRDVTGGVVDPSMPYKFRTKSGKSIALFFYDGPTSRAVAFEGLLSRGEDLANRLLSSFSPLRDWPQLSHIATDGETYGHHHRFGDMALAYALEYIENNGLAQLTNYAEYLSRFQPDHEIQIIENTAWSCAHGVERWRSDCGCNTGGNGGWNQSWREPLRAALDYLRDALGPLFEKKSKDLLKDPWEARDDYISVILDRSRLNTEKFLARHQARELDAPSKVQALKLLEMQRNAMLMYTSCGWFFDDLANIETVQVMHYAARALQLAEELGRAPIESKFLRLLEKAHSNDPTQGNGAQIYTRGVSAARVDLQKVGAHYAVSSLFESVGYTTGTYCYSVEREDYRLLTAGRMKLAIGRARVCSDITWDEETITFGVLHLGDHNFSGGVRGFRGEEAYFELTRQLTEVFNRGEFPALLRLVDQHFESGSYTLKLLFRDEQRKILNLILETALNEAESMYRRFYEGYAPLMRFVTALGIPLPKRFHLAADYTINSDLLNAVQAEHLDPVRIVTLMDEARSSGIPLDSPPLEFALRKKLEAAGTEFRKEPHSFLKLRKLFNLVMLARAFPFDVRLWEIQNGYYRVMRDLYPAVVARATQGDQTSRAWVQQFEELGRELAVRLDPDRDR